MLDLAYMVSVAMFDQAFDNLCLNVTWQKKDAKVIIIQITALRLVHSLTSTPFLLSSFLIRE